MKNHTIIVATRVNCWDLNNPPISNVLIVLISVVILSPQCKVESDRSTIKCFCTQNGDGMLQNGVM